MGWGLLVRVWSGGWSGDAQEMLRRCSGGCAAMCSWATWRGADAQAGGCCTGLRRADLCVASRQDTQHGCPRCLGLKRGCTH
jgi:hypothetical protein